MICTFIFSIHFQSQRLTWLTGSKHLPPSKDKTQKTFWESNKALQINYSAQVHFPDTGAECRVGSVTKTLKMNKTRYFCISYRYEHNYLSAIASMYCLVMAFSSTLGVKIAIFNQKQSWQHLFAGWARSRRSGSGLWVPRTLAGRPSSSSPTGSCAWIGNWGRNSGGYKFKKNKMWPTLV